MKMIVGLGNIGTRYDETRHNAGFMVAGVIVNRTQQEIPNEATMKDTEDKAVSVVVEAARKLLA